MFNSALLPAFLAPPRTSHPAGPALSVARLRPRRSMHHFSPAPRSDMNKGRSYGTASPLVRWLELHSCPAAPLFPRRSGDGFARQMQLCVREKVKWHKKAISVSRSHRNLALYARQINQKQKTPKSSYEAAAQREDCLNLRNLEY